MTYPVISTQEVSSPKKERWLVKKQKEEAKNRMKSMKHKEYQKLRVMVPSIASKPNVSKVTVIEEAVRYIDHLHVALLTKLEEQESISFQHKGSVVTKSQTNGDSIFEWPNRTGNAALELMKKADFSLYSKLRDQMEYFASRKFRISGNLKYIDGECDEKCMVDRPDEFPMN